MRISRDKTDARPGLVGGAASVAVVCAAVALLSGCGGWPYIGPVSSTVSPPDLYIPYPPPPWPSPPQPPIAEREPERLPPIARPDTSGDNGDPASLLPVPAAPRPDHPGGAEANAEPPKPKTELPPAEPLPAPPAGSSDDCSCWWCICHVL
jgi:hypothetical protein